MKRVLSLVLAFVLVLGMIPAYAADSAEQKLVAAGFINGGRPADLLTRAELSVLVNQMNGVADEADAWVIPSTFADADDAAWANGHIAVTVLNGWMVGVGDNKFNPNGEASPQMVAAVMLNALNYKVGTDVEWANVLEFAADLGITLPGANTLTRAQAFEAMWSTVNTVVNGEEQTLGVKLGKLVETKPVVTDLEVKSVTATNLKEVMVEFNNEIDKTTMKKENFKIGSAEAAKVVLQADGKTVMAWFDNLANQTAYTLAISSIKDVNGSEVKDFTKQFTVSDFVAPTVVGVEVIGNKKLVVTFSEPVNPTTSNILSNYKINDLLFGASITTDGRVVTIITSNRLPDGVHTLSVSSNVVDFAGFKLVSNNTQFAVAKDEVKPAFAALVSASQTEVVVTLSKPVEDSFTVAATVGTFVSKSSDDNQTWKLTFNKANPLPLSGTEIKLTDVVDYYGNKGDITFNVVPAIDLVRPEVKSVTVKTQSTIEVEFTKAVELPSNANGFVIKTDVEKPVTLTGITVAYAKNDKDEDIKTKLVLTRAATFAKGDYTVEFTGVIDTTALGNVMVPYTAKLVVADLTAPTVSAIRVSQPTADDAGKIIVEFSEKVDATTALDKANYSYILNSTKPMSLGTAHTITLLADGKAVQITVPKNTTANAGDSISSVTVVNVTDVAGNKMTATIKAGVELVAIPSANLVLSNVRATAVNKVVVDVPKNINPATVTAADFRVHTATGVIYVINAEHKVDTTEGATVDTITLTLSNNLNADATYTTFNYGATLQLIARNLTDIYGNKVAAFGTGVTEVAVGAVVDKIAPSAVKVADTSTTATTAVIRVDVTEALVGTFDKNYIVVKLDGKLYTASSYSVAYDAAAKQVVFTVTTTANLSGKAFSVEYFANAAITDGATAPNELASFSFTGSLK